MHRSVWINDCLNHFIIHINYPSFYILIKAKYISSFHHYNPRDSTLCICTVWPDHQWSRIFVYSERPASSSSSTGCSPTNPWKWRRDESFWSQASRSTFKYACCPDFHRKVGTRPVRDYTHICRHSNDIITKHILFASPQRKYSW